MDSQIEEIKNKLNVVDVVGSYVKLTKTGANFRGICPFHSERKPSFFVSPGRQMWHCFGCGEGSSIFDFVMKIEGIEFGDALRILANRAGVQLKRENVELRTERQRLYEICELACRFFEKQLGSSLAGKEANEYLLKRGITQESIVKWRLGYSPDTWNGLSDFLIGKGYKREEIVKAGLAIEKEQNKQDSYDRFRGRIIFPVFDISGQVVGYGGRVFKQANEKEIAKYINSPQTILYDKSGLLYGLHNAKLEIRKQNHCVVTEGYTDVIMCHQAGFINTVASSGTALTEKHLTILKRYSENLVLAFDMDVAGDSATKRGINLAESQGFNIKIIEAYGDGVKKSDPAEIILKDPKIWEESITKAKSIMDYYFDSAFAKFDKALPEGKKEIGRVILPAIKRLTNNIEQSFWVQKLAQRLEVKEEAIVQELAKVRVSEVTNLLRDTKDKLATSENSSGINGLGKDLGIEARKKLIEEKIIALLLKEPEYVSLVTPEQYELFTPETQSFLKDPNPSKIAPVLALQSEIEEVENVKDELLLCILQLKNIELKNKLDQVSQDIKKAEADKDSQKLEQLMDQFHKLTKQL